MGFKKAADGVAKKGKTEGTNLGDTGPTVAIQTGKGKKGASSVTSLAMKKYGRNLARAMNQKSAGRGR
jgi:hypothetical protein